MRVLGKKLVRVQRHGFSLIEMLIVIAIIGILAGLVLGIMPGVIDKRTRARVQVELSGLISAIEYYKEKHGFYPLDNPENIAEPPLFYELVGTRVETTSSETYYYPLNDEPRIGSIQISNTFGGRINKVNGFLNSAKEASEVKNFYPTLKPRQYNRTPFSTTPALVLTVPAKGPKYPFRPGTETTNTWRYIVAKAEARPDDPYPTNNPSTYDLWAEVVIGRNTHVIGNWRQ